MSTSARRPTTTEALRLSEEKFAKAFRISPDAILISSFVDGRIFDANDSFLRITGYTRDEVIGHLKELRDAWVAMLANQGQPRPKAPAHLEWQTN